MLYKNKG